jgi:hypothetical protein
MSDERLRREERINPPGAFSGGRRLSDRMSDARLRREERINPPGAFSGAAGD